MRVASKYRSSLTFSHTTSDSAVSAPLISLVRRLYTSGCVHTKYVQPVRAVAVVSVPALMNKAMLRMISVWESDFAEELLRI